VPRRTAAAFTRTPKAPGGWSGAQIANTTVAANTKILLATITPAVASFPLTIRRVRMQVSWETDQSAADEHPFGAIGLAVLNDTAIAVGIASLPDPVTDIQDDIWMLFQALSVGGKGGTGAVTDRVWDVDSKAMRKLPEGKSGALIIANGDAVFGASCQVTLRVYSTFAR